MRSSRHSRRPSTAAPRPRTKPPRRLRRAARVLRVLVAEDNLTNQKLVSALLDQHGHHVSIVSNGRLAVERAAQEPFDIILMDVQMPEMSGLEATAAIREAERHTGRHIPIVALTARAMAGDREQCLAAGMDAYVSKPVQAEELFSTMEAMAGAQRPPAAASLPATASPPDPQHGGSVDLSALLAGFGGRADLVKDVIDVFLADAPAMLTSPQRGGAGIERRRSGRGRSRHQGIGRAVLAGRGVRARTRPGTARAWRRCHGRRPRVRRDRAKHGESDDRASQPPRGAVSGAMALRTSVRSHFVCRCDRLSRRSVRSVFACRASDYRVGV